MQNGSMTGRRLGGYKIEKLIDEGGMSTVYEAVHMQLGRRVAVKQLNPLLEQKDEIKERFKSEATILSRLKHPRIVTLYDYIECEDGIFIIMELIKGHALDDYLKTESGPIPEKRAVKYFLQMLDAIGYIHSQNIIHRDIKPSNFIVTDDDEIKILDFGIAKILGQTDPHITKPGTKVGTVLYMSPQQVKGQPLDRRTDIYSLGILFFHILTGQVPYDAKLSEYEIYNKIINEPLPSLTDFYVGVSPEMEDVVYKATSKKPLDRYQNCNDFAQDIIKAAKINSDIAKNNSTQLFELSPVEQEKGTKSFWRNFVMILMISLFAGAVAVSMYAFGRQDQMHVIADNAFLYRADSLTAAHADNLNYGETVKIAPDKPEVVSDGITWTQATSLRGAKGWIPKNHLATPKIYQQINSIFFTKEAAEQTSAEYKTLLWKYFIENKFFRNAVILWKLSAETPDEHEYNNIASGLFNSNSVADYACVLHSTQNNKSKLLIFFDNSSENLTLDFNNDIKIRPIPSGEKGGGWFLGNTLLRTGANGVQYEVNKYDFLPHDGLLIYNPEDDSNTVCIFNDDENRLHLYLQPK